MTSRQFSSGDLLADRRAAYARMLAEAGDFAAAAELMRDALALAPGWIAGWFQMGEWLKKAGRIAEASDAWREVLRLDPRDRMGARLELELVGAVASSGIFPSAFTETLYDQYADRFEDSLVGKLNYRAPQLLAEAIAGSVKANFAHALDLGCGTGLMGERLRGMTSFLEGSDLSAGMLAKAGAKGIYDRLIQADLQHLEPGGETIDLVVASDVFIYLGRLDRLFSIVAAMLSEGGVFAFTVERHDGDEPLVLRESRRYAHSRGYISDILAANRFERVHFATNVLRNDRDQPIEGLVVVARKREAQHTSASVAGEADEAPEALPGAPFH